MEPIRLEVPRRGVAKVLLVGSSVNRDVCQPQVRCPVGRVHQGVTNSAGWKEHDAYEKVLERLLRDLKVEKSPATKGYPDSGKRG